MLHNFPFKHDYYAYVCSDGARTDTSFTRNTAKGVACETKSDPGKVRFHGVLGCMIDTKDKRMCLLAFLNIRNAISSTFRFCYTTKNRIIL